MVANIIFCYCLWKGLWIPLTMLSITHFPHRARMGGKFAKEVSSKWEHHHSFPDKRIIVLPMAPPGQAVVLQLAAAARGGVPTAGQGRLLTAVHSRQTHQIPCAEHEVRICWSQLMPSPCLFASHTFKLQGHHHHPTQSSAESCWGHLGSWVCLRWK